jgi:hypothetical protein
MANLFGVNVESPEETQRRLRKEQLERMEAAGPQSAAGSIGQSIGRALSNMFGAESKQMKKSIDRADAERNARDAAAQKMLKQDRQNHLASAEANMRQQGAPEPLIQETLQKMNAGYDQEAQRVAQGNAQAEHQAKKDALIKHRGIDPRAAQVMVNTEMAARLDKLGSPEDLRIADGLRQDSYTLTKQMRAEKAQAAKVLADDEAKARKADLEEFKALPKVRQLQVTRDELIGDLRNTSDPARQEALRRQIAEMDAALTKETGTAPDATMIKAYGETNKAIAGTSNDLKAVQEIYYEPGEDGKLRPNVDKAAHTAAVMSTVTDRLMNLEMVVKAIESGVGVDDGMLSQGIASVRQEIMSELTSGPNALTQAEAVRLIQVVETGIIREARSYGGPITESDTLAARIASGAGTGRVDLTLERQVRMRREEFDAVKAQAVASGKITVDESGNITSRGAFSNEMRKSEQKLGQAEQQIGSFVKDVSAEISSRGQSAGAAGPTESPGVIRVDENGNIIQ